MALVETKKLKKIYHIGEITVNALNGVDLVIEAGEFVAITGKSGAGKSTLLYQLSLLDDPTEGEIVIEDNDITKMTERQKTDMRLNRFGYVFQDYALVPELTALENVVIPLLMSGCAGDCYSRAEEMLGEVELGDRLHNRPSQLSGGQQQRVAIARALVNHPEIVFADEPTANLDTETSRTIMDLLDRLNKDGQTIVMVTHEDEYAKHAGRVVNMEDGVIV